MEVLAVRISPATRSTTCTANGLNLEVGTGCIVESDRGHEFGIVTRPVMENRFFKPGGSKIPVLVRRATRDDEEAYAHKASVENVSREFCQERIRSLKLKMKLGQVEMQLDGKKLTFYFTAEGRVDFRALVRDLAAEYHTRIELRQVGARDDAQMDGGCGPCGRDLCCSTWLKGFQPVSIKMAKSQGLSLNPSKISGMCGRLMCCLKYEYDPSAARSKGRKNERPNG